MQCFPIRFRSKFRLTTVCSFLYFIRKIGIWNGQANFSVRNYFKFKKLRVLELLCVIWEYGTLLNSRTDNN